MGPITYFKSVLAPWVRARVDARTEVGASLVEYALLAALIAVVCIVGVTYLGTRTNDKFSSIGSQIS